MAPGSSLLQIHTLVGRGQQGWLKYLSNQPATCEIQLEFQALGTQVFEVDCMCLAHSWLCPLLTQSLTAVGSLYRHQLSPPSASQLSQIYLSEVEMGWEWQ